MINMQTKAIVAVIQKQPSHDRSTHIFIARNGANIWDKRKPWWILRRYEVFSAVYNPTAKLECEASTKVLFIYKLIKVDEKQSIIDKFHFMRLFEVDPHYLLTMNQRQYKTMFKALQHPQYTIIVT